MGILGDITRAFDTVADGVTGGVDSVVDAVQYIVKMVNQIWYVLQTISGVMIAIVLFGVFSKLM